MSTSEEKSGSYCIETYIQLNPEFIGFNEELTFQPSTEFGDRTFATVNHPEKEIVCGNCSNTPKCICMLVLRDETNDNKESSDVTNKNETNNNDTNNNELIEFKKPHAVQRRKGKVKLALEFLHLKTMEALANSKRRIFDKTEDMTLNLSCANSSKYSLPDDDKNDKISESYQEIIKQTTNGNKRNSKDDDVFKLPAVPRMKRQKRLHVVVESTSVGSVDAFVMETEMQIGQFEIVTMNGVFDDDQDFLGFEQ